MGHRIAVRGRALSDPPDKKFIILLIVNRIKFSFHILLSLDKQVRSEF